MPHPSAMNGTATQSGARHRYGKHVGIYEKQSRDRQEALPRTRELAALVLSLPPGRGFHEKAGPCQAQNVFGSLNHNAHRRPTGGATLGRITTNADARDRSEERRVGK